MSNRFVSSLLILTLLGVGFAQQAGDPGTSRGKGQVEDKAPVLRMAVQVPTPAREEVVIIFSDSNFVVCRLGQRVSIPTGEKFRGIYGEAVHFVFLEKGNQSGNDIWTVSRR